MILPHVRGSTTFMRGRLGTGRLGARTFMRQDVYAPGLLGAETFRYQR